MQTTNPDPRSGARVTTLLTAVVALLAILVVGLAAGAALAWREVRDARRALTLDGGSGGVSARDTLDEIAQRQQRISSELAAMSRDASRQIAELERRAAVLRSQGGGPVETAKRAVEMTQLMVDEMMLQLKLMSTLDSVLEKTSRPLEAQRALLGGGARRHAREGR